MIMNTYSVITYLLYFTFYTYIYIKNEINGDAFIRSTL